MLNMSMNNGPGGGAGSANSGVGVSGTSNLVSSGQMSSVVPSLNYSNVSVSNVGLSNNSSRIVGESNSISLGSPFIYRPNRGHPNFNPTKPVVQLTQRVVCFNFIF